MIRRLDAGAPGFEQAFAALRAASHRVDGAPVRVVLCTCDTPEHPFPGMGALSSPLRAMLLSDALDDFAASGGGDALARYDI